MKRSWALTMSAVLVLACSLTPAAAAPSEDPASVLSADAIVYLQADQEIAQLVVRVAAAPPVIKLFMPAATTPYAHVNRLLGVADGRFEAAAPHVRGLAFAMDGELPLFLISFDDARWPKQLVSGCEVDGNGVTVLRVADDVGLAALGNHLVVSAPEGCGRAIRADYATLATSAPFLAARKSAGDARPWGYVGVQPLLALIRANRPRYDLDEFDAFVAVAGLDHVESAWVRLHEREDGGSLELTLRTDGRNAGVLGLLPDGELGIAREAPDDTAAIVMLDWGDASAVFGGIRDFIVKTAEEMGEENAREELAEMEAELGITLDQLFGQLGSGAAVYIAPPEKNGMIGREDWVAVLPLDDAQGFKATMDTFFTAAMGMPPPPMDYQGISMHQVPGAPVAYAVTDTHLVAGGGPAAIKRYVDWRKAPSWNAPAEKLPHALFKLNVNLGRLLTSYPETEAGADLQIIIARNGNDIRVTFGMENYDRETFARLSVTTYGAIMAAMLMPALHGARTEARKAAGRANLHNIGLGLIMWQEAHDGNYPATLRPLYRHNYVPGADMFVDPADPNPPLRDGMKCSYEYVGPIPANVGPATIMCYSRRGVHEGGRNVLHRDLVVMWVTEAQLGNPRGDVRTSLRKSYDEVIRRFGDQLTDRRKAELKKFYEVP